MKYLFVCCEGLTEEAFVAKVLAPYFKDIGVLVTPSGMNGIEIAQRIGIVKMTVECAHFKQWIDNLTAWAKEGV